MKQIKVLCVLTALLIGQQSMAQVKTMVVWYADKTTTDIELSMLPRITFVDNKVIIQAPELQMEIDEQEVLGFTYKNTDTSGITAPQPNIPYIRENQCIVFNGITAKNSIAVYKTNGERIPIHLERRGNDLVLSLLAIPSGVYLLNVNGRSSKFIRP